MRRLIVKKLQYEGVSFKRLLDDAALDAGAAPVDEAYLAQPRRMRFGDVLLNDGWDVSRRERVQVENAFNRNSKRRILRVVERVLFLHFAGRSAVRGRCLVVTDRDFGFDAAAH